MKLLIIGSDKIYAIENFYVKYIREQGVDVLLFPAQNYFYDYYHRSITHKIIYRTGLSGVIKKINEQLKEVVTLFKPDAVMVFKGMEITPASLQWLRKQNIYLVNYNPDNPFIFSGKGSGNKNVRRSISLYDLHFTYNNEIRAKLESDYHVKTAFLPFGFDLPDELFEICSVQEEIIKLCFVGNPDEHRAAFIQSVAEAGIAIDIYGNDWVQFVNHPGITLFPPVYGDEFWKILSCYRVQLNLMRIHNEDSHNMRTFEIPGVGGIMLAPATTEHKIFFTHGKEVFLFSSLEDCIEQAKIILQFTKQQADIIRQKARLHSLKCGYNYKERIHLVLKHLEKVYT